MARCSLLAEMGNPIKRSLVAKKLLYYYWDDSTIAHNGALRMDVADGWTAFVCVRLVD